jgi:hypothetical protein
MRVKISVALVSAWLLLHSQPVAADGIGGWPKLRWGMTKQQVQKAYPNFEEFDKIGIKLGEGVGWMKAFGLHSYAAAGCEFLVSLDFDDNQLVQVRLESYVLKGSFYDKYCTAKDTLTEQYGQPTINNVDPMLPMFDWIAGDTKVTYFGITAKDTDSYKITVVYEKRGWLEDLARPAAPLVGCLRQTLRPRIDLIG